MASQEKESMPAPSAAPSRNLSPASGLRQRPLRRAQTIAEPSMATNRRRSSMFSENMSDARKSVRSSTEDLLFPKISTSHSHHEMEEPTHWYSLPLGLALLPAVGGMIFKDGSAFITDVTLLALAAIFMNWALRMPWEWYHAAQSIVPEDPVSPSAFATIEEEPEDQLNSSGTSPGPSRPRSPQGWKNTDSTSSTTLHAQEELRTHEILAFISCFALPFLAAWLLHGIRSQLSRPSEGLVSNYNLTIFLLVAEVRPLSHLIKMIQNRTLFLQKRINLETLQDPTKVDQTKVDDLIIRIEDLEAHIADGIASKDKGKEESSDMVVAKASSQATSETRKSMQPELDALNRAMRRYEKRSTISAVQHEARMQELETRVRDVVVLAAAAQRNADHQPRNFILILTNWLCALVVVPVGYLRLILSLPYRLLSSALAWPKRFFGSLTGSKRPRDAKGGRKTLKTQPQDREKRIRAAT